MLARHLHEPAGEPIHLIAEAGDSFPVGQRCGVVAHSLDESFCVRGRRRCRGIANQSMKPNWSALQLLVWIGAGKVSGSLASAFSVVLVVLGLVYIPRRTLTFVGAPCSSCAVPKLHQSEKALTWLPEGFCGV